ncbi:MAG: TIGR03085 family metal-binding protein [Nocardioidaceae bacterium]
MTHSLRMSQRERTALCDTALQVGEDQPTLSGEWTVKDLVVHLLVREGSPTAAGIFLAPLARLTELESRRLGRRAFNVLVEKLRSGPPLYSPYAVPKLDSTLNTLEFFVHLEDIRRAQPEWSPRALPADDELLIWALVRTAGKGLTRKAPVGVTIENSTTGSTQLLKGGDPMVTVRGLPSELALYVFGRRPEADVELLGDTAAVAGLKDHSLGF